MTFGFKRLILGSHGHLRMFPLLDAFSQIIPCKLTTEKWL